ncbi:MAG: transglutaminase domain-containing protein, partial [Sedimentisphaerales bacterium]|nr:transglutaminase domain-containing protein [Sedimentisphaerales bacterium]
LLLLLLLGIGPLAIGWAAEAAVATEAVVATEAAMATEATEEDEETYYYAAFLNGQKLGYIRHSRTVEPNRILNTEHVVFSIKRAEVALTVSITETSIETPAGEPLGFESRQYLGALGMTIRAEKNDRGTFDVTTTSGSSVQKQTIEWPAGALMAEGLARVAEQKGLDEGTRYMTMAFVPTFLQAVEINVVVGGKKTVDLLGRRVELTELNTTMNMPGGAVTSIDFVDADQVPQKMVVPVMGMQFEMVACSREFALSPSDVPEFLDQLILRSPAALDDYRTAKKITYHLVPKPDVQLTVVEDDNQRVRSDSAGGLFVTVEPIADPNRLARPYRGDDPVARKALEPTRFLQSDSPEIQALARQAAGDIQDAAAAARKIEAFVRTYVQEKSLSIGYASAVEVASSREGDCTEHAVLTAALCQAAGIPARLALGYIYAPQWAGKKQIFVGHAWTQAYIDDKWIGLDGTRGPYGYTAGHLTLAVGNGNPEDFFHLVLIQGQFEIAEVTLEK